MFSRLLLIAALAAPLAAQNGDDVAKYLTEIRAKYSTAHGDQPAARAWLAQLTKRVETTTDRSEKATLYREIALENKVLGDLDAAIAAMRLAHELAPEDPGFSSDLAVLLAEAHQNAEASAILGADTTDAEAMLRRAEQLVDQNEKALAVACLQVAQKLLPEDAAIDDRLAIAYLRAERVDEAIRDLNRAAAKAPDSALIHLHLAYAFARKDYRDYARGELDKALECHPSDDARKGIEQLRAILDAPK